MTRTYTDQAGHDVESISIELDDGGHLDFDREALDNGAMVDPGDHWVFVTCPDGKHITYPIHRIRWIKMRLIPRENIGEALLAAERLHMEQVEPPCTCTPLHGLHQTHCEAP